MRVIVYVHGACSYQAGYSDQWFSALRPYTAVYGDGELGDTRFEVVWSDLINHAPAGDIFGCIQDFEQYLSDETTRQAVIDRFTQVVAPLLEAGHELDVVSHSWGAVVAYEALRAFPTSTPPGVLNWFVAGSALARPYVLHRLVASVQDGRRPGAVKNWWNLSTQCDPIGGTMKGPYAISDEWVHLPADCGSLDPLCCHAAYFDPQNITIQGLLGKLVNQ